MIVLPICLKCKNLKPHTDGTGVFYCNAYQTTEDRTPEELKLRQEDGITIDPKGIPDEIIFGEEDHLMILPGQIGDFTYTPNN